jgi:LytR cell envelope-related transcriptional attenuator
VPRLRRRRRVLLAGIGMLTAAGVALAVAGVTLVRHSTAGRYIEGAGPDDPGYEAFVVPTPVMALFQRGDDGELVGVAVLALESHDGNGSVVLVAPSTLAGAPGSESTLAATYRDGGAEGLAAVLADLLAMAIPEHLEVDDPRWASLVGPVAPVELQLDEPVGEWPAGDVSLTADDVGPFLAALAAGEDDADRIDRQEAFWTAWLPLVERAGDGAVPGEIDVGIGRFVRGLAEGEASIAPLPMAEAEVDGADAPTTFRVNGARLSEVMARAVPYPESPGPDRRIRVRLLNGTRDADLTSVAASRLVEGGAQISIVGNAASFDVPETHMTYGVDEERAKAEWLAAILGGVPIGEDPASQQVDDADDADEDIDVTVILGADARDLIGR